MYRDVEVDGSYPLSAVLATADAVPLPGLAAAEVGALLRPVLGERADSLAVAVHGRTGGNPFFVTQVGHLATGRGDAVPAAVGDAIRRRFARLPQATMALLGLAVVAGGEVDAALVAVVAGVGLAEAVAPMEPAGAAGVLRPTGVGVFWFEHDLFRETAYADLNRVTRGGTHLAVARALVTRRNSGGEVRAGDIAHHWYRAVPPADPSEALRYLEAAARDATARLAHEEAARHWRQALRLAELAATVEGACAWTMARRCYAPVRPTSPGGCFATLSTGPPTIRCYSPVPRWACIVPVCSPGRAVPRSAGWSTLLWVCRNAEDVHPPGRDLHRDQNVEPPQQDGVKVEEVRGQQPVGLLP
jgi:hypothetical protein